MKYFTGIKIKYQLIILIGISIFLTIVVQMYYYISFNDLTQKRADKYFTEIVELIKGQIVANTDSVEQISHFVSYSKIIQDYLSDFNNANEEKTAIIQDVYNNFISTNKNIRGIALLNLSGRVLTYGGEQNYHLLEQIVKDYGLDDCKYVFNFYSKTYYDKQTNKAYYAFIKPIFTRRKFAGNERLGVSIVICSTEVLQEIINNTKSSENWMYLLFDNNERVMASNKKNFIGEIRSNVISESNIKEINNQNEVFYNKEKCLMQSTFFINTEWRLFLIVPISNLVSDMGLIRTYGIIIVVFAIFLISVIGIFLSRSIMKPISQLVSGIRETGINLKNRLNIPSTNEISEIADHVNTMLSSLEEMTGRIFDTQEALYNSELAKKQARFAALQSQINPHFLYNTLECIRSIALYYKATEIMQISISMAKIFRYSIKNDDVVTIKDEIDCIKEYYNIISIRYNGKYDLSIGMENDILDKKIAKMVLQPIIENSIYHGLENKCEKGSLKVNGYFNGESSIIIEVIDDGKGMDKNTLELLRRHIQEEKQENIMNSDKRSIGLNNIYQRMRLIYGEKFHMEIESVLDQGTTIKIIIPSDTF